MLLPTPLGPMMPTRSPGPRRQIDALEHRAPVVGLGEAGCREHLLAQAPAGQRQRHPFLAAVVLDARHLLDPLDPRLLLGAAGLGALSQPFQLPSQLRPARLLALGQPLLAQASLLQVMAVAAGVAHQLSPVQVQDAVGYPVQEIAVVGHHQEGARRAQQILLEPGDGLGVHVVGGLVQHQQVRRVHEGAGQGDPLLLATAEGADGGLQLPDTQARQDRLGLGIRRPAVGAVQIGDQVSQPCLEGVVVLEGVVIARSGQGAASLRERPQQGQLRRVAGVDGLEDGGLRVEDRLLGQVADAYAAPDRHRPRVRWLEAGHDAQQRRLAAAVAADEADAVAAVQAQVDAVQQHPLAELLPDPLQRDQIQGLLLSLGSDRTPRG